MNKISADGSVLKASSQIWKLNAAAAGLLVGGIALMLGVARIHDMLWTKVALAALAFDNILIAWVLTSVRCPHCSARWLWMAVTEQPSGKWITWLLRLRECPRCAYPESSH